MNTIALGLICCPCCEEQIQFQGQEYDKNIHEGRLNCEKCHRSYQIEDGIPHFIGEDEIFRFSKRAEMVRSIYLSFYTPLTNFMFLPCGGAKKSRHEVLDRLEIHKNAKILETGIGTGDNLPFLIDLAEGIRFYGIDNQIKVLSICARRLKKWNSTADLFLSNAEDLPFIDNVFDVVFHLGAINIFRNKRRAIEEMIRVARPGTKIVIADETDKANKYYSFFLGKQEKVVPPVDLIPPDMLDIRLDTIWNGFGYAIEFRIPPA